MFHVGGNANLSVFRYSQRKTLALGVLPNATAQREYYRVAVESRLYSIQRTPDLPKYDENQNVIQVELFSLHLRFIYVGTKRQRKVKKTHSVIRA